MAVLTTHQLNRSKVKADLREFKKLLEKPELAEAEDILPFFKARPQICAAMGLYNPNIIDYKKIGVACEFDIFGDHKADLVIGDVSNHAYSFIEFEEAKQFSLFKHSNKQTPEWSAKFEHGFSQLVDWILWLENNTGNTAFKNKFKTDSIEYNMILVIGRDRFLTSPDLRERLDWRTRQVVVASKKFNCITFDMLYKHLCERWSNPL